MRTLRYAAGVLLVLLALAGCGRGGPTTPATTSDGDVLALGRQIAQCFRDNGIPDFPDPVVEQGHIRLPGDAENEIQSRYPEQTLQQVQSACQSLIDQLPDSAIESSGGDTDRRDAGPQDVDALRQWAECLRQHGFPDWPDPKADGSFPKGSTPIETEGKSDRMIAAAQACQQYWSGGITLS
jgi:hypothetical protein